MTRGHVVTALGALIVGGLIGFLMGQSLAPSTPPDPVEAAEQTDARSLRVETPGPAAPEDLSLERALASIRTPPVPEGDGVITGRVTTGDGAPLAGVEISAFRPRGYPRPPVGKLSTLVGQVRHVVGSHRFHSQSRRQALTDGDGAFRLDRLTDHEYSLSADLAGYRFRTVGRSYKARPGSVVEFIAEAVAVVRFEIGSADGSTPAEATVTWKQEGRREGKIRWRPAAPETRLTPGRYAFHASSKDGLLRSEPQTVELVAGPEEVRIALSLAARSGIHGKVVFEDGLVSTGLKVALVAAPPGSKPDEFDHGIDRERRRVDIRSRGPFVYSFPGLVPGNYLVALYAHGKLAAHASVSVSDRLVEQNLLVRAPTPDEYVLVRVLGPDGKDLPEVRFTSLVRGSGGYMGPTRVNRLPDGRYRVIHPRAPRDAGTRFGLTVKSKNHGQTTVEFNPVTDRELTVRLTAPAILRVIVDGASASPYGAKLRLTLWQRARHGGASGHGGGGLDAQGMREFDAVPPGKYEIALTLNLNQVTLCEIARDVVTLAPGVVEHRMTLPVLHDLVVDPGAPGTSLGLRREGVARSMLLMRSDDGRYEIHGLPAGVYFLESRNARGTSMMRVTVPNAGVVRFEPSPADCILVAMLRPEGVLARAGLRPHDLITAIDGKEYETFAAARDALNAKRAGPTRLTVLRDGASRTITVDLRPVVERGERVGAALRPGLR